MKKYYLETLSVGCPKNILESASYRKFLESNSFEPTSSMEDSEVIVLNTCGCLNSLQDKARVAIQKAVAQKKGRDQKIIVAGCYPLIDKGNNLSEIGVSFFPPGDMDYFARLLSTMPREDHQTHNLSSIDLESQPSFVTKPHSVFKKVQKIEKFLGVHFSKLHNFTKAIMMTSDFHYVTVGKGCLGNCTFCGIKLAIGNPSSRPLHEVINGMRKGLLSGKRDFWLVSDDIGSWGQDIGMNSANLLEQILLLPADMNIVVNYFEPEMFLKYYERLRKILADKRIIQICLPLQTGSQKLLKKMGRTYDIQDVLNKIEEIRKNNPQLVIKTQYITGFPGETWWDYFLTIKSMIAFDGIGVNAYARVKYTPAYKLKPLPDSIIQLRKAMAGVFVNILHLKLLLSSLLFYRFENK